MLTDIIRPPEHLKKIQVMIVDNDSKILSVITSVLYHLGFKNILQARDGFEAVKKMRGEKIDLIITDWELQPVEPDEYIIPHNPIVRSELWQPVAPMDGACLVKYIRMSKFSPNPYVAIIMLTGLGLRNHIEYARDCGVNEIILKPLMIESLCERIALIIDKPRPFVMSPRYRGPCRRHESLPFNGPDRRKRNLIIVRHHNENPLRAS